MDKNKNTYNTDKVVLEYSHSDYLLQPEKTILDLMKHARLNKMLDIGVGAGRTTKYFAPFFNEYHGADYSEKMIDVCREKFLNDKNISFSVCDACDLQYYKENEFDFILFSFNGIDCISLNDKIKALREIHRVGKNNAYFAFSFHNIYNLPKVFSYQLSKNPLKWFKEYKRIKGVKEKNPIIEELLKQDSVEISDGDLNFTTSYVYTKPQAQIEQLKTAGFKTIAVYDLSNGAERAINSKWDTVTDAWIYLLCRIEKNK